jgi:putative acetyltransferase
MTEICPPFRQPPLLRPERGDERGRLIDLWQAAWQQARPDIDFGARRAWFTEFLANLVADGHAIIVADLDGMPAGFATIHPMTGYLDTLAVATGFQRRGVAGLLLDAASAVAAPVPVTLKVNTLNTAGLALYAAAGFVEYGSETKPENGETVLLMRRGTITAP